MRLRYLGSLALVSAIVMSSSLAMAKTYTAEPTLPSIGSPTSPTSMFVGDLGPLSNVFKNGPDLTPGLGAAAEGMRFADNPGLNNGFLFIPPDPSCAAGFAHILDAGNNYVEWRLKNALIDTPQARISMDALFAGTPGMLAPTVPTNLFDTRCTYDKYSGRFFVVSFQRVTSPALSSCRNASRTVERCTRNCWARSVSAGSTSPSRSVRDRILDSMAEDTRR